MKSYSGVNAWLGLVDVFGSAAAASPGSASPGKKTAPPMARSWSQIRIGGFESVACRARDHSAWWSKTFNVAAPYFLIVNQSLHIPRYRQLTGPNDEGCKWMPARNFRHREIQCD
jgi:hypothetical protein